MNSCASTVLARTMGGAMRSAGFAPISATETAKSTSREFTNFQRRFEASSFCTREANRSRFVSVEVMAYLLKNRRENTLRLDVPAIPGGSGLILQSRPGMGLSVPAGGYQSTASEGSRSRRG